MASNFHSRNPASPEGLLKKVESGETLSPKMALRLLLWASDYCIDGERRAIITKEARRAAL